MDSRKRRLVRWAIALGVALVVIGGCLTGLSTYRHRHSGSDLPAPRIDALTDVLNKTAEAKLAAPSLASEQLVIIAAPEQAEARAKEVGDAATQVGGTAVKTMVSDGSISLLAQVSGTNAALFRSLVRKEQDNSRPAEINADDTHLIEVTIKLRRTPQTNP